MRHIITLAAITVLLTACNDAFQEPDTNISNMTESLSGKLIGGIENDAVKGSLLIKLDENTADAVSKGLFPEELSVCADISEIVPAVSFRPEKMEVAKRHGLHLWHEVRFDKNIQPAEIAERLADLPFVKAVQINSNLKPSYDDSQVEFSGSIQTKSDNSLAFNDPMFAQQWNLVNNGDESAVPGAKAGADIGVKDAWRLNTGDPRVIVAVFDEGVMAAHPDLTDAMWINSGEIAGNGKDDDENGYVDDVNGYNFAEDKGRPTATGSAYSGHGTHVAGIIAATNNNGKGVSSIAGGSGNSDGVRIMSCQIFRNGTKASDLTVSKAFIYAADHGACIAQCSYGSEGGAILSDKDYINGVEGKNMGAPLEYAALQYFLDPENSNCDAVETNIAVFAAGNNSGDAASYPGALPFCISVTAFGPDFLPGGYSNRGPGCDIAAPGGDPWTYKGEEKDERSMILSTGITGSGYSSAGYVYNFGTSMACPHVSGVAALGMSYALELGLKFTREEFISMLLTSVNNIDQFLGSGTKKYNNSYFNLSSYKGKMGTGSLDAWQFLNSIEGIPSIQVVPGEKVTIDIKDYLGETVENMDYDISADIETMYSLGLESVPKIRNGKIEFTCTKIGSGRIKLSSSIGKDSSRKDGIGGLDFSRNISIISRPVTSGNGGWL